ncbi:MAG: RNA polymerase sigma factor SigK [Gemmatimonadota bacterium]
MNQAEGGPAVPGAPTDADLVARVRLGDERAFEVLVRRHLGAAHRLASGILRERADADDVCQDAFIVALRRIDQCRAPERFRAWLLAIVRNAAIELARKHDRFRSVSLADTAEQADASDPGWDAYRSEIRSDVLEAVESLTALQRRVLLLHDLEGWRHRDIAMELGITPGSSRVHLHVARKAVRIALEARYSEA